MGVCAIQSERIPRMAQQNQKKIAEIKEETAYE
jgi:hypothetical protein